MSHEQFYSLIVEGILDTATYIVHSDSTETEIQIKKQHEKLEEFIEANNVLRNEGQQFQGDVKRDYNGKTEGYMNEQIKSNGIRLKIVDDEITTLKTSHKRMSERHKNIGWTKIMMQFLHSITEVETKKYFNSHENVKRKDAEKYIEDNRDRIITMVLEQYNKKIKDITEPLISDNQKIEYIYRNQKIVAYKLSMVKKSLELQNILKTMWATLPDIYSYDSNSYNLDDKAKKNLTTTIREFMDTVFWGINRIVGDFNDDSTKVFITLHISVDGYADSQGFKNPKKGMTKEEENKDLSEKRAYTIMKIISDIYNKKVPYSKIDTTKISMKLEESFEGHGEKLPYPDQDYEPDGKPDKSRRIIQVQCMFDGEMVELEDELKKMKNYE
jgi:outer membrane protein OmpA-like peptidoglycan-associated protein